LTLLYNLTHKSSIRSLTGGLKARDIDILTQTIAVVLRAHHCSLMLLLAAAALICAQRLRVAATGDSAARARMNVDQLTVSRAQS
jgi:hypothetical protein